MKITTEQTANGFRRSENRARIDKVQRQQRRTAIRHRTALRVLRLARAGEIDAEAIADAHRELEVSHNRIPKWAARAGRLEAREGKFDARLRKSIERHQKGPAAPTSPAVRERPPFLTMDQKVKKAAAAELARVEFAGVKLADMGL